MKTQLICLFFLGVASLLNAQTGKEAVKEITLEDIIISSKNYAYVNKVQDKNTAEHVKQLENKVAIYDVTELPIYDRKFDAYEVLFEDNGMYKGRIVANYDSTGKILSSVERFENVGLPPHISNTISNNYPDWEVSSNSYLVTYYHNRDLKKTYNVKIKNGDKKKTLKIDSNGFSK